MDDLANSSLRHRDRRAYVENILFEATRQRYTSLGRRIRIFLSTLLYCQIHHDKSNQ